MISYGLGLPRIAILFEFRISIHNQPAFLAQSKRLQDTQDCSRPSWPQHILVKRVS